MHTQIHIQAVKARNKRKTRDKMCIMIILMEVYVTVFTYTFMHTIYYILFIQFIVHHNLYITYRGNM